MQTELSTELVGPRHDATETEGLVARAEAITISSNDGYERACQFELGLKALDKRIVDHHKNRKHAADQLHKMLVAEEKEDRSPVQLALNVIRPKRIKWEEEQERLTREEEQRRQEAQRKADEEKRLAEPRNSRRPAMFKKPKR